MRRAMMTNRPFGSTFTVGGAIADMSSTLGAGIFMVSFENPAPRAGTITSVQLYGNVAGTVHILTGTVSGSTFTTSAYTSALSFAVGVNTLSVSLSIPSGGYIALLPQGAGKVEDGARTGASVAYQTAAAAPTAVGQTYSLTTLTDTGLAVQGTGS